MYSVVMLLHFFLRSPIIWAGKTFFKYGRRHQEDDDDRSLTLFPPHLSQVLDQRLLSASPPNQKGSTHAESAGADPVSASISAPPIFPIKGKRKKKVSPAFSPIASSADAFSSTHVKLQLLPKSIPMASCCAEEMLIANCKTASFFELCSFRHSRLCNFIDVEGGLDGRRT
jgi:hypothetical protein